MSQLEEVTDHGAGVSDADSAATLHNGLMEADEGAQSLAIDEAGVFQIDLHVLVIRFQRGTYHVSNHAGARSAEIVEFVDQQGFPLCMSSHD